MKPGKKWGTAVVVLMATAGTSHLMQTFGSAAAVEPPVEEPQHPDAVEGRVDTRLGPVLNATVMPTAAVFDASNVIAMLPNLIPASLDALNPPAPAAPGIGAPPVPNIPSEVANPAPLPSPGPTPLDRLARAGDNPGTETMTDTPTVNEYGLSCGVVVSAASRPSAMVNLSVAAPCLSETRMTIRHEELIFSAELDALGLYSVHVPALATDAVFTVALADGEVARTEVQVPDAEQAERVILQYNGRTGLQIHALEFGADYGEAGHVWAGNPRDAEVAVKLGGGYLTALGDPTLEQPFLAEVYTLPRETAARDGVVRLNVEAEVSNRNCAKTIAGQTLQRQPDGEMTPVALTLSMPDCDAIGEFLVLKNLLRDLKIASN